MSRKCIEALAGAGLIVLVTMAAVIAVSGPLNGVRVGPAGTGSPLEVRNEVSPETAVSYAVTFTETGLPQGKSWSVYLNGVWKSSLLSTIPFSELNGTYPFDVASNAFGVTPTPSSGYVTVAGAPVSQAIKFTSNFPKLYGVTFKESGLPNGTSWSVTELEPYLSTHTSTWSTITFVLVTGKYDFVVGSVPGYAPSPSFVFVALNFSSVTIPVTFMPAYSVTFEESGLPAGTSWSVAVQGFSHSSNTANVVFNETNGSYSFTLISVLGYTASPSAGTITVAGQAVTEAVTFSVVTSPPAITSFFVSSPAITIGSGVTFTVTAAGGVGALSYAYADLPLGCSSTNTSTFSCRPTSTGTFTVQVTVTDAAGGSATATTPLTVNPQTTSFPPAPGGGGPTANTILGLPALEGYVILVAVTAAIAVGGTAAVVRSRRKRRMRPGAPPSPPPK